MNPADLDVIVDYAATDFVEKCINCGECLRACPIFPLTKYADIGPEAMIEKVIELLKGGEISDEAYDMIWSCSGGCNRCAQACPQGLRLNAALLVFARAKMFRAGKELPYEMQVLMAEKRSRMGNDLPALQVNESEESGGRSAPANLAPVDMLLVSSCSVKTSPHVLMELEYILGKMGLKPVTLHGGDICCGAAGMIQGDLEAGQRFNQTWASAITAFNPKKVIICCFGCERTAKGGLFPALPVEFQWTIDFLSENADKIPFTHKVNKVVTPHDGCDVGASNRWEPSRRLLEAIPGITVVEMEHSKENYRCCAGVTGITHPEIAEPIQRSILQEAKDTGADVMVTTCLGCQKVLSPLGNQYSIEVRNLVSLLAEACGIHHEN